VFDTDGKPKYEVPPPELQEEAAKDDLGNYVLGAIEHAITGEA